MNKIWSKIKKIYITFRQGKAEISKTREILPSENREMEQSAILDATKKSAKMTDSWEFQSETIKSGLTSIVRIANPGIMSSGGYVDNYNGDSLGDGPAGNRTPETLMSNQISSQTRPITDSSYQKSSDATTSKIKTTCPYCSSGEFVKRGTRQKKRERVQLYICKSCGRTFTPFSIKGKHFPLNTILDAISYYNLGFSLEQVSKVMKKKQNVEIQPSTIATWVEEHKEICAYHRMRPFAVKEFSPYDVIETCTLAHRQLYHFRYHRAKIKYIMEDDFKHYKFYPLKEFLNNVSTETPHQYFQEGLRMSEAPIKFSKAEMIVRNKENFATHIAKMILEGVKENKQRHETLQKFMIANDSVTVATEVPVYIRKEDLAHMQTQLGFKVFSQENKKEMREIKNEELPRLITGHIDFLQIRNGSIHIMDYKSDAAKERPIEQLTLYALALSRLTGLRVFHFKCAWFDEKDYFEFFPLHAVYKPRRGRKKVYTKEGEYDINNNAKKMEKIRPGKIYNK